jgi:hypothetical protein
MMFNWKPWAWLFGFIALPLAGWGVYKMAIGKHAVADAKLEQDYRDQKDSTKAWKESYKIVEDARKNLEDTLGILDNLLAKSHAETQKWHDSAARAKGRLVLVVRPLETDSTNPRWMHRAIELESVVASQDKELAGKDAEIALGVTQRKLLVSQMSKDSVALHSANDNIDRLDKLVERYKAKSNCKVAWVLPCLSRTQSFVAGAVASGIGTVLVNRGKKK